MKFFRATALAAGLVASLATIAPAAAGPISTAGPLAVAANAPALPVETVAYRHHVYHHYRNDGAGALVAGAALGLIGMAMANGFAGDYDCYDCGYGGYYGGPVYGGWGGGWHGGHFRH